ncbi:hypothetical protein GGF46_001119, partial [Coemansia sp. RSA 552]
MAGACARRAAHALAPTARKAPPSPQLEPEAATEAAGPGAGSDSRFPVRIRQVVGRGRGFFAARDIAPGETVFRAVPLAWAISEDWVKNTCWWCFAHDFRKQLPVKAAGAAAQGTRRPYKGVFCSSSCMQAAVDAYGGPARWACYLSILGSMEADIHAHKTQSARAAKNTGAGSRNASYCCPTGAICQAPLVDAEVATFPSSAASAQPAGGVSLEPGFDPDSVSDEDLAAWISSVWDIAVDHRLFSDEMPDSSQRELVRLIASALFLEDVATPPLHRDCSVVSTSAAGQAMAPLSALESMRSNETDYFRAWLRQQPSSGQSGAASPSTPATLVPICLPLSPTPMQIKGSWWGAAFRPAASAFALLGRSWPHSTQLWPVALLSQAKFRKVYFREMANSFGIYDPPTQVVALDPAAIDSAALNSQCEQEWVGFCIYPTA